MFKRIWLLLLVLLLLLAACSTAEEPAKDEAAPASTEAPAEVPASADEGEEQADADTDTAVEEDIFVVGMMQIATHPALDAGREGALKALADAGIVEGENLTVILQNAEGDIATLTTIAQSFVDEGVDMIIATSTPAGQAAFNVVKDLGSPYVIFNVVTDPFAAGLATAPDDHEAWIVGAQALPPVEQAMSTMMEIVPQAKSIGIIWNPSEKNSEVATMLARSAADKLGVELVEGNISDSSEIKVAAEALVAQGIDAFFISTDSTVVTGFEALVKVANENEIPLFANDPASAERGAAAAIGVDYFQNGYDSGELAAKILNGEATAGELEIVTQAAGILHINYDAANEQGITFSSDIVDRAVKAFGEPPAGGEATIEGNFTIGMMQIATHPALDAGREGALKALADAGIVEGENLTLILQNAEGDIATLTTIAQGFVDEGVDMIIATSTPAGQAAFNVVKDLGSPYVVFNVVTDPFAAGLATAADDHEAWIVGAQALPPVEQAMSTMMEIVPQAKSIGIIWNPSEKNSEVATMLARDAADKLGVELVEGNISDSSEIKVAAEALVAQGIEAFFISTDSTVVTGFEALVKVANENEIPLFANDPASAERGAAAAVGVDYFQNGYDSGELAAKILKGEATAGELEIVTQAAGILHINYDAANVQGITFPADIVTRAAKTFGEPPAGGEAAIEGSFTVGMMKIVSHPALDAEQRGVKEKLAAAGFIEGENLTILEGNAEGDIATLSTIAQQFLDEGVDLIVATSTPALQAAYNATKDMDNPPPIVFNAVTSPYAAGVATAPDDHPDWVIGIQALGPIAEALGLIPQMMPGIETVGYLYNPAEANSVVNTEIAVPAAVELGLNFEIVTVSNSNEVQTAAEALVSRGVEAFFVSTDSTVVTGLEALVKVANENDIPLFANDPASAERGAAVALGLDYYVDGLETGELAVAVLKGELDIPSTIIEAQDAGSLALNLGAAAEQGLEIPQSYIDEAATIFE